MLGRTNWFLGENIGRKYEVLVYFWSLTCWKMIFSFVVFFILFLSWIGLSWRILGQAEDLEAADWAFRQPRAGLGASEMGRTGPGGLGGSVIQLGQVGGLGQLLDWASALWAGAGQISGLGLMGFLLGWIGWQLQKWAIIFKNAIYFSFFYFFLFFSKTPTFQPNKNKSKKL